MISVEDYFSLIENLLPSSANLPGSFTLLLADMLIKYLIGFSLVEFCAQRSDWPEMGICIITIFTKRNLKLLYCVKNEYA